MLRRSEKMKTALLDAVTHDLRTPLTSIKASVTTLLGEESAGRISHEGRRELLEVMDEEADRLNRFIEEMTELARIEAGRLLLERAAAPADEILNNAIERASKILAGHEVVVEIGTGLPPLDVDAVAISAVVFELLENAAKYSPAGSRIEVRARAVDAKTAEISVADAGRGIPAELRDRVFEKFFRVDEARGRERQGFGLGLAIARGIVEAHGHHIWARSGQYGRGAVVAFTVPCASAAPAAVPDERISATHSRS
jgi:two-component system sensor histidine kinase KdpD